MATNQKAEFAQNLCISSYHHIHFRTLFSSTEGWAFWQVFLEGVLSTQNDFEGQQNPYLVSFFHSQALHPMISLACQIFSVQPHSACVLLRSSLCCALHVQTISSYWCGAPSFVRRESELTSSFALTLQIQRIMARSLRRRRFSTCDKLLMTMREILISGRLGSPSGRIWHHV